MHWVGLGQLGHCIECQGRGRERAVMADSPASAHLLGIVPDLKLAGVLCGWREEHRQPHRGVADALSREGHTLLPSTALLADQMATAGR